MHFTSDWSSQSKDICPAAAASIYLCLLQHSLLLISTRQLTLVNKLLVLCLNKIIPKLDEISLINNYRRTAQLGSRQFYFNFIIYN